jgi:hypothetical protein
MKRDDRGDHKRCDLSADAPEIQESQKRHDNNIFMQNKNFMRRASRTESPVQLFATAATSGVNT